MAFNSALPVNNSSVTATELRGQFNGLFDLIQTIPAGPAGPAGVNGAMIDGVTTDAPGTSADATVALTAGTLHFSFSIPRGDVGAQGVMGLTGAGGAVGATGATGPVGPPFTSFDVASTMTLDPAQLATASAFFDGASVRFNFGIPRGNDGVPGAAGATGATGPAFTSFVVDSVTTLSPFLPATVSTTFDGTFVRFAFGIPQGEQGMQGMQGNNGSDGGPGPQGPQGAPGEVSLAQLDTAIANTSSNSNAVAGLAGPFADPDAETLRQKLNELIAALRK